MRRCSIICAATRLPETGPGASGIVVAVSELPGADLLVRAAKRIADALRAPWTAVHVETPRYADFGEDEHRRLAAAMNLASRLGGEVLSLPAPTVLQGLISVLTDNRATQLIVGKSNRSRWFELRHGSVVDRVVRATPGVAVHVLPMEGASPPPPRPRKPLRFERAYGWTLLMIAGVTGIGLGLSHILQVGNIALLYLVPVLVAASIFGRWPGIVAGLASSLAYNFFFLPPTYTLTVSNPEKVVTLVVLLTVALVTSHFAARARVQADIAASSARQNAAIAGFSRQLTATGKDEELMQAICAEVARLFDVRTVLLMPSPHGPAVRAAWPPENQLGTIDVAAAQWALETGTQAGRGSDTLTSSDWLFTPLRTASRTLGVIGLARDNGEPLRSDKLPLFMSLIDQASLVLERLQLEGQMRDVAELRERDRLRAALLSSVSHDLRTPITSILGAVPGLRRKATPALIDTVESEAMRLNRFVANLLDMARVEAGALKLGVEPVDLTDAVAAAVHDTRRTLEGHEIRLDVSPALPLVRVDPQLFHHCLINLLDNAGRYGDPGTAITIEGRRLPGVLTLSIIDEGPGLPAGREREVFETFRRLEGSDRVKGGTGLGLAIVKGFAEAMGLSVTAANRENPRGACFSLHFPEALLVRESEELEQ